MFNQTNIGAVSRATLGRLPRGGVDGCVQPDKYWRCFKGNLGETTERWGGVRTGLSERYNAILSQN